MKIKKVEFKNFVSYGNELNVFEIPENNFIKKPISPDFLDFKDYLREYITKDIAYHISWIKSNTNKPLAKKFKCKEEVIENWEQVFKDINDCSICFCELSFNPDVLDLSIVITL